MLMRGTPLETPFSAIYAWFHWHLILFFYQQSKTAPFRLPQDHQLFSCLTQAVAEGTWCTDVGHEWLLQAFTGWFNWLSWCLCSRCGDGRPLLAELHGTGGPSHLFSGWISRPAVLSAAPTQHSSPARSDCRKQWTQQGRWTESRSVSGIQWARWTRCVPVRLHHRHMHD